MKNKFRELCACPFTQEISSVDIVIYFNQYVMVCLIRNIVHLGKNVRSVVSFDVAILTPPQVPLVGSCLYGLRCGKFIKILLTGRVF